MDETFATGGGILVLAATIVAIVRGMDVRLALFGGALLMGGLAGDPWRIVTTFFDNFANERYLVPICTAMAFAYVLREASCDRHMVLMLMRPVQRIRVLLIPGAVAVGFLVNTALISQASTAVAVGVVVIPLLRSVGLSPGAIGSTLLLGASLGGELLNPGAPELQSVARQLRQYFGPQFNSAAMQPIIGPLLAVQGTVATGILWWRMRRESVHETIDLRPEPVNYFKAIVPLIPLALLMMAGPPLNWFHVPESWLINMEGGGAGLYATRLIGLAMIFGAGIAMIAAPRKINQIVKQFAAGAGHALAAIVSIIVAANCFGEGIKALKLADWIGPLIKSRPKLVWPLAAVCAFTFAVVCGSGMATTESLYRFFAQREMSEELNLRIGAVVSIAAAAGRTTSPAAAVVFLCATLVEVNPIELLKRVCLPLIAATVATTGVAVFLSH